MAMISAVAAQAGDGSSQRLEDFDALWGYVRDNYAYFDQKRTDWDRARELFRPQAASAEDGRAFVGVLERLLDQLYDPHTHLGVNTPTSPRLIPSGSDLWAEWHGDRAIITAVRHSSEAEHAGVRAGMEIRTVNGLPVATAIRERMPVTLSAHDPAAEDWALRAVLAGRRGALVRIEAAAGGEVREFAFDPDHRSETVLLTSFVRPDGVGYIRFHNSLGDLQSIAAFDRAIEELKNARALVLDLRATPSGGNTTVARGIMGRLVPVEKPYQRHELAAEERQFGVRRAWLELVAPRGPFVFTKPVIVLVGRWTGSMGEGIAIGLDGTGAGHIIGTPMAGLLGATYEFTLPHAGFRVNVPAERLYHVNGTPRENFRPEPIMLADPEGDEVINAAVAR